MSIKTWGDRLAEMEDGAITTSHHVTCAMQDEIDELRVALKAQPVQEPCAWQYKTNEAGLFVSDQCPADVEVWNDIEWSRPLFLAAPVQPAPLTDADIRKMWASENGLEDCDMCYLYDFKKAALYFEARVKTGGAT